MNKSLLLPTLIFVFCCAIYFGYFISSYSFLPERMPSHFDWRGHPDAWMPRSDLTLFLGTLNLILPILVLAMAAWAPDRFKNLPNRAYWLAPERRENTQRWLFIACLWFCSFFTLFNTALYYLIVQAAIQQSDLNAPAFWSCLGLLLGLTLVWLVIFRLQFRLPPSNPNPSL